MGVLVGEYVHCCAALVLGLGELDLDAVDAVDAVDEEDEDEDECDLGAMVRSLAVLGVE